MLCFQEIVKLQCQLAKMEKQLSIQSEVTKSKESDLHAKIEDTNKKWYDQRDKNEGLVLRVKVG